MQRNAERFLIKLLRGISTDHIETVRDAWRALLSDQEEAIPVIKKKLNSNAWKNNPPGPLPKYFGILLALLSEMDGDAFRQEVMRLGSIKLHPVHRRTLNVLAKRLEDAPSVYLAETVPVFIANDVANSRRVIRNLQRWSKTKGLSLNDVTRFDVIAERPELDYLGRYNLFFSGIVLTQPTIQLKGLISWIETLNNEVTFYHEVGHHVLGHSEGGQVAEQEGEANAYPRSMIRASRPFFFFVVDVFKKPLKLVLKPLFPQSKRNSKRAT
ncbi:hypothetical protein [Ruegeria arenilitoris]|uniref:hypothetical protein n=1 Tax=Ruegeria arenilitoris TaxID=1173585 RepID=UPI001CFE0498|nr:hypothetical protein [Ruegeria arenilitoris]